MLNASVQMQKIESELLDIKGFLADFRREHEYLPVVGQGPLRADIMFVGEAPGQKEALTGQPFCGRSGRLLDELLASVGLARKEIYITNIVKDRPPKNRDPKPAEIEVYAKLLDRQIEIVKPKVVVTLGRFAMDYCLKRYRGQTQGVISNLHGSIVLATFPYGEGSVVPLYHPALALYNPSKKEVLLSDFKVLEKFL